jgi:predicted O-linked N-acetylglucosamine transferase (SPINDLY family)
MEPLITQVASLRLAPVQAAALGHPVTSGIPTVDYYISCSLMEPDNGQEHYSEKLVLLPNIGKCIIEPNLPKYRQTRSYFNLAKESIVYLCCQSLFKYLPQYDYIFPAIALEVPQAQFAFIKFPISELVNQKFRQRLDRAFAGFNLDYRDYCVILPRLDEDSYLSVNLIADIFLDSFTWSGGYTTITAITCDLPVVTCPGELMRGRHSYGILKMIGVEETIAQNEKEYLDIAISLGKNFQWRKEIVEKIKFNKHKLYGDKTWISSLEEFLESAIDDVERAK